jgi:hypothetical protein
MSRTRNPFIRAKINQVRDREGKVDDFPADVNPLNEPRIPNGIYNKQFRPNEEEFAATDALVEEPTAIVPSLLPAQQPINQHVFSVPRPNMSIAVRSTIKTGPMLDLHIEYRIVTIIGEGTENSLQFESFKRFREFVQFDDELSRVHGELSGLVHMLLPPKSSLGRMQPNRFKPDFIESRRFSLERYLRTLLLYPDVAQNFATPQKGIASKYTLICDFLNIHSSNGSVMEPLV